MRYVLYGTNYKEGAKMPKFKKKKMIVASVGLAASAVMAVAFFTRHQ